MLTNPPDDVDMIARPPVSPLGCVADTVLTQARRSSDPLLLLPWKYTAPCTSQSPAVSEIEARSIGTPLEIASMLAVVRLSKMYSPIWPGCASEPSVTPKP